MAAVSATISLPSTLSSSNSFTTNKLTPLHRTNQFASSTFIPIQRKNHSLPSQIRASIKPTNKAKSTSEQKWTHEGVITESLPNGMFMVLLDNEDEVLGYISGRIRRSSIRILPGDRVKIEVSRYDSNRGRIVYRLRGKDLNENPTAL